MEKLTSKLVIFFVLAVVFLLGVMFPYRSIFDGGLSTTSADWGAFGSYLSGTLGPVFSFLSILAVVFVASHQIKSSKSDLETQLIEQRRTEKLEKMENRVDSSHELLISILNKQHSSLLLLEHLIPAMGWQNDEIAVSDTDQIVQVKNRTKDKVLTLKNGSAFEALNTLVVLVGVEKTRELVFEKDAGMIKSDITTYSSTVPYIVKILIMMINSGYDPFLARYIASAIYQPTKLINKVRPIDPMTFNMLGLILSIPTNFGGEIIDIKIVEILTKELNIKLKLDLELDNMVWIKSQYSKDTALHVFIIKDKETGVIYKRDLSETWHIQNPA